MLDQFIEIYADSSRGQYIPQFFAESHNPAKWTGIQQSSIKVLLAGPEDESYWDCWQAILDYAETIDGGILHQGESGDVFVIYAQAAIEAIDSHCQDMLEYETEHKDAGDNYAHMPGESWTETDNIELRRNMKRLGVESHGMHTDEIAEIALDIFDMESGHIHIGELQKRAIILASFPVSEIEIDLSGIGLDDTTLEYVADSCDAYIKGNLAYLTTDSVWFAVVSPEALQTAIEESI